MFIKLNSNNKIEQSSNIKIDDTFIETDKEIVRGYDGRLYFEDEEPDKPLELIQSEKIAELKANCQNYILSVYPIYKQLNIINPLNDYSNEDKLAMNTFIDDQRAICASKEEEINNSTLENINNILTTFED